MRIIGGRDYFDSAMGLGIDKTIVFNRTTKEDTPITPSKDALIKYPTQETIKLKGKNFEFIPYYKLFPRYITRNMELGFEPMVVWFAGVRYGGIKVYIQEKGHHVFNRREYFWTLDSLNDFLKDEGLEIDKNKGWDTKYKFSLTSITEHFNNLGSEKSKTWLIENNISIAINNVPQAPRSSNTFKEEAGWKFNSDGLKEIGFAKVLDAYSAFQNLAQWVSGVLPRPAVPMIDITDEKTQLQKHGMDNWSFKTMPTSKK